MSELRAPRRLTAFRSTSHWAAASCVAGLLLFAVWHFGTQPVQQHHFGDDQEYLTMTTSFTRHFSPDFRFGDDTEMRAGLPRKWDRSLRGKFFPNRPPTSYFEDKAGRFYGYHFFTYPAVVAPMRALLGRRDDRFRAHQYTNLIVFSAALLSLLLLSPRPRLFWSMMPLVFLTPVLWFLEYAHTEAFVFSLCIAALSCYLSRYPLAAIAFNSIAATQYQPLALVSLFLCVEWCWSAWRRDDWALSRKLTKLPIALALTAIILVPGIFYYVHFGTPNLIARQGFANVHLMSWSKFAWMFVDPNGGMLIYTPGALLMMVWAAAVAAGRARRQRDFWGLGLLACALGTMFASTCQLNWNHPTFGVSRYVLYGIAPTLLFVGNEIARLNSNRVRELSIVVITAIGLQLVAHRAYGFFEYTGLDSAHHSRVASYVLEHWPTLYSPPAEIFCERTVPVCHTNPGTGDPLPEYLPAIWRDSQGVPRKILAQRCDLERVLHAASWTTMQREKISAVMRRCRGAGTLYIDL